MLVLDIFKIYYRSETPNCKGELGLFLVPTPLVATMKYLVKSSLLNFVGLISPLKTSEMMSNLEKIDFQLHPQQQRQIC